MHHPRPLLGVLGGDDPVEKFLFQPRGTDTAGAIVDRQGEDVEGVPRKQVREQRQLDYVPNPSKAELMSTTSAWMPIFAA
jgi:hypothetical protein